MQDTIHIATVHVFIRFILRLYIVFNCFDGKYIKYYYPILINSCCPKHIGRNNGQITCILKDLRFGFCFPFLFFIHSFFSDAVPSTHCCLYFSSNIDTYVN
eukprot:65983_1